MMAILTNKLYQTIAMIVIFAAFIFFAIIQPRLQLAASKEENKKQEKEIRTITHESKVKVFETKYGTIKIEKSTPKEKIHEEPNLTIGIHTIVFE